MKTHLQSLSTIAQAKRVTHPIIAILLSFAIVLVSIVIAETLSDPVKPIFADLEQLLSNQPAIFSAIAKIFTLWSLNVPIYLFLWGWLVWFERRPFRTLGFMRQSMFRQYLSGLGSGLLMVSAAAGISVLLQVGHFLPVSGLMEGLPALGGILLVYLGWAVQASAEETMYRGWLLQVVSSRTKAWIGVAVSSLCFAGVHSLNNGFSLIVFCNLVLFGLFLALYRIVDGSLWGVCAWHTVWNWALGNIYGAAVGGSAPEGGRLFHIDLAGPDWLTGGAFGLEGSIVTTAVFLIGIIVITPALNRKQHNERRSNKQANSA